MVSFVRCNPRVDSIDAHHGGGGARFPLGHEGWRFDERHFVVLPEFLAIITVDTSVPAAPDIPRNTFETMSSRKKIEIIKTATKITSRINQTISFRVISSAPLSSACIDRVTNAVHGTSDTSTEPDRTYRASYASSQDDQGDRCR